MIKNVTNVLENNFEWMKRDFILLVILIIGSMLALHFVHIHGFFQFIIIAILGAKAALFIVVYTLHPGLFGRDQFSWKFIQGLPLSKKELIFSLTASTLLATLPILLWMASFWLQINKFLFENHALFSKNFINLFLIIILFSITSIHGQIQYPRREYQKKNANNQLIKFLSNSLLITLFLFALVYGIDLLETTFGINVMAKIIDGIDYLFNIIISWWSSPILLVLIIINYYETLSAWANEKKAYRPNDWNPKKEYSIIAGSSALLILAYINIDFTTPGLYTGTLTKAVFEKKYSLIESELKLHPNINSKNKHGMTPMLVAIKEGNVEMAAFLEKRGANFEGMITDNLDKRLGFDAAMLAIDSKNNKMLELILSKKINLNAFNKTTGYAPLHLATHYCKSRMVDLLIKNGSDVNLQNDQGETPLIVAARSNCFSAAVSLKEAGAKFDITDKKGKNPLERLNANLKNKEFEYFIEKNSRLPASLK